MDSIETVDNRENKVGMLDSGYKLTIGKGGVIPADTLQMLNRISKLHTRLKNVGPIDSDEDGFKRNEDVKLLNGARNEIDRHEKMLVGPLDNLKVKIVDKIRPFKQENAVVTKTTKETIIDWSNRTRKRLEKERVEKEKEIEEQRVKFRLERDEQIRIANEKTIAIETERLLKVEEKERSDLKKKEKEKLAEEIGNKIEETLENKDELGEDVVNKELGDLAQQKNIVDEELQAIDVEILKKRDEIRKAKEKELIIKDDILVLEQEPLAAVKPASVADLMPKFINIATYDRWEVEDIDEIPDEWAIMTKVENKEKINDAFKLYPNMQIKGIRRYKSQIVRAPANCPNK